MTPEHDRSLSAYADLIVRVGLNLQALSLIHISIRNDNVAEKHPGT